jgi:chromosome segregation ATPase
MQKLEQIESFGAFLDFLSNPKEYEQLVKDVRQAAKDHKELVEKERKIKDIDAWRASEGVRISKLNSDLDNREQSLLEQIAGLSAQKESLKKDITSSNKRLRDREQLVSDRENSVSELEKERDKLKKLQQESIDERLKLQQERDKLKQREAQIKAAIGGS